MKTPERNPLPIACATLALPALPSHADASEHAVANLIAQLRSADDAVRGPGWQKAGPCGAPAVKPLAALMNDADFEVARSARRALRNIVRHAGRPGASREARAVTQELVALLASGTATVRREALWMLSEVGGDDAVKAMAGHLSEPHLREDARCALTRLPGRKASSALRTALVSAPDYFKPALADALRARGETVPGFPSQKLVPTRPPLGKESERKSPSAR